MKSRRAKIAFLGLLSLGCAAGLLMACRSDAQVRGEPRSNGPLKGNEIVQSVSVSIEIGAAGPLDEPLGLDLGLGFPLWLSPVGRSEKDSAPFGAIPQTTTAGRTIEAGKKGEFTFFLEHEVGQDRFRTTPQLLGGVRVADISRVGFVCRGEKPWTLKSYEVRVNDQLLAANSDLQFKPQALREPAEFELADLGLKSGPLKEQVEDLKAIEKAGLATDADRVDLQRLGKQLDELTARQRQLRGSLDGRYPWYIEPNWSPIGRQGASVQSVRVTLITAPHPGAETQNIVYFQTGGHKYPLSSPELPLTSAGGPQVFELDLVSAPLTAADFRGFALGMLAGPVPYAQAPDRWAPQRMRVDVDEIVVYDSETYPFDQKSLAAIRLIPPAHLNEQGELVTNETHSAREAFAWEMGKAQGLDPATGGAIPIPGPGEPGAPLPEPGTTEVVPGETITPTPVAPDGTPIKPDETPVPPVPPGDETADTDFPPFPGEDVTPQPQPQPVPPWPTPLPDPVPVNPWPVPPIQPWDPLPPTPIIPPQPTPQPTPGGKAPQIAGVRVKSGWRMNEPFVIAWNVSGDESRVKNYRVSLHAFAPDQAPPVGVELASTVVAAGTRTATVSIAGPPRDEVHFLLPRVSLAPQKPKELTPHLAFGPVKPVFPPGTDATADQLQIFPQTFQYVTAGQTGVGTILFSGEPNQPGRAVWAAGTCQSHLDFSFDAPNPGPGWNLVIRPQAGDQQISVGFLQNVSVGAGAATRYRFVTYAGFSRGKGGTNQAQVTAQAVITPLRGQRGQLPPVVAQPVVISSSASGLPNPMQRLELAIDPARWQLPAGRYRVAITVRTAGGAADPSYPPALFGTRWIRD